MNVMERFSRALAQEFPRARVVLYTPDDEQNGTWSLCASQGHEAITVEWHSGLEMIGLAHGQLPLGIPEELVSFRVASERVRHSLGR